MIVQIIHNAVTAKLLTEDREVKLQVQAILSYKADGAEFSGAFKSGSWDGRSSFFEYNSGKFPRGFVALVQSKLSKLGYKVQVAKKPYPIPLGPQNPVVDSFPEDPRYSYQPEVFKKLENYGQIIAQVATGGGKSRIAKLATARIGRRTLFLTTRGVLMYQMYESFKEINPLTSVLGDGNLEVSDITCGMVQTIASHLEEVTFESEKKRIASLVANKEEREIEKLRKKLEESKVNKQEIAKQVQNLASKLQKMRPSEKEFIKEAKESALMKQQRRLKMIDALKSFEFVILEEAHESSGNSYYEILQHCTNAHYRLALTATPFMKDSEEANMRLMASSGHVAITVTEETLINLGILAKPYFKYVDLPVKPEKLFKTSSWQRAYEVGIVENEYRNKCIAAEALRAKSYGLSVMVLVQHKNHGKILNELLTNSGLRVDYIFGEDDQAERKRCINRLKNKEIDVLIGSTILDVGVDVPAVGMVILAGAGKAEVALRQRVGRGLRAKKYLNFAFVVDFADGFNKTLFEHFQMRKAIIQNTKGFGENIVKDFDFKSLGYKKVVNE